MINFNIEYNVEPKHYDVVVGLGLYLTGKMLKDGKLLEKNLDKEKERLLATLNVLQRELQQEDEGALLLIIDDCSPHKVDLRGVFDNYCIVELEENVGIGHKENILETVATSFAPLLFRFDQDVKIKGPMKPLFDAFDKVDNLFGAGINSGFIGAMISAAHKGEEFVFTPQLANGVLEYTPLFSTIGFTDPNLKYFHDLDLFYRARDRGYQTVMAMECKGSAVAARAAGTMDFSKVQQEAEYLVNSNPSLKFYISKKGLPHILYRPYKDGCLFAPPVIKTVPSSDLALSIRGKIVEKRHTAT
jgi:hypothetical protein